MRNFYASCIVFASALLSLPAGAEMKVINQGKAIQIQTDEYIVRSDKIDRDFIVEVTRPDGLQPNQKTAAIYATDGGFGVIGPAVKTLTADGKIPKVHVISIGYPNERGRHMGPRHLDLTHGRITLNGQTIDGNGEAFEAFLLDELRPFIEARYPIDTSRSVLFGHSMGGLFVANVLLRKPEAFTGYLIGGLPIVGDPSLIEKAKSVAPKGNGRRIFIGYCPTDVQRLQSNEFTAPISGPNSTFKVMEMNFTDERHNSEILMLVAKGFRFLLPTDGSDKVAVTVKPEILDRYVGTYQSSANRSTFFMRDGQRFFAIVNGSERVELFAESETNFFARDVYASISFSVGADGKADGFKSRINEVESTSVRVK